MPAPTTTTSNVSPAGDSTSLTALGHTALLLLVVVVVAQQLVRTRRPLVLPMLLLNAKGAVLCGAGWQQLLTLILPVGSS